MSYKECLLSMSEPTIAIKVENLTKIYRIYEKPSDRLKESLHLLGKAYHRPFAAVDNVSFEIKKGEAVGIIGKNGAGKSTLLKMLTGVLTPTSGKLEVNGKVSALLELGAGFNPELTGIENIFLNGTIMGYSHEEINERLDDVIKFADIGQFIDQPVKMYSSGMFARLAFAVAISVEPDILIVDEALSVGDIYFQAKCIAKMKELAKKSTILFVSHSMGTIKSFCESAILIDNGKLIESGDVKRVAEIYENMVNQEIANTKKVKPLNALLHEKGSEISSNTNIEEDPVFTKRADEFRSGTGGARFIRADLLINDKETTVIPFGAMVTLRIITKYYEDIDTEGTIGYMIRNHNGIDIFGMNIYNLAQLLPPMKKGAVLETKFTFKNILSESGKYTISLGLKPVPFEPLYLDSVSLGVVFEVPPIKNNYVPGLLFVDNQLELNVL